MKVEMSRAVVADSACMSAQASGRTIPYSSPAVLLGDDDAAPAGQLPSLELTIDQLMGIGFRPAPDAQLPPDIMQLMTPATQMGFLQYEQQLLDGQ